MSIGRRALIECLESRCLLATVPTGFLDQQYGGSISNATAMEFAPDGRLFVLTQGGQVRVITAAGSLLATPALTLGVNSWFERGLLGIAFDPDFSTTNHVFLYYSEIPAGQTAGHTGTTFNRISRFTINNTTNIIDPASETLVVRLDQVTAGNHNGGALHFGPDGKLYLAVGDNAVGSNAQSVANRLGKILRLNKDGSIPADNPASFTVRSGGSFVTATPTGDNRAIWALGLRNPFTTAFHPTNGRFFINDVGDGAWEEVDEGIAGRNFGWNTTEGNFIQTTYPPFTLPVYTFQHGTAFPNGNSISGGAFYSTSASLQFPQTYQGKYFFGDYVRSWIAYIDPSAPPAANGATLFASGASGVVDLKVGPDGSLYYLQRGGTAGPRRILPDSNAPSISQQPQDRDVLEGRDALFSVTATGQATLAYQWQRDGVDIAGATAADYTLTGADLADDDAVFRVRISNGVGIRWSNPASLNVTPDDTPPTVTPLGFHYNGVPAQVIRFGFSEPVGASIQSADLLLENLTSGQNVPVGFINASYDAGGNIASFTFPGYAASILPNGSYRATLLAAGVDDLAGNHPAGNSVFTFTFLNGDANGSGAIDIDDYFAIDRGYALGSTGYANGDFNYSGQINGDDYFIIDQNYLGQFGGMSAGAPEPVGQAAPSPFSAEQVEEDEEAPVWA